MEDKKVFCARAEDLESIQGLDLSEEVVRYLEKNNRPIEMIIAAVRLERDYGYSCMDLLFPDEPWETWDVDEYVYSYRDEIIRALERSGYFRCRRDFNPMRMINFILGLNDPFDDWFHEGVIERNFYHEGYKLINEKYEMFDFSDKLIKIFEILKDGLTKDQYEVMKFKIMVTAKIGIFDGCHYSDNERSLLRAAQENISRYLKDEIVECILS